VLYVKNFSAIKLSMPSIVMIHVRVEVEN